MLALLAVFGVAFAVGCGSRGPLVPPPDHAGTPQSGDAGDTGDGGY